MSECAAVVGVAAVIEQEGRLLIVRRAEGIEAPGAWCFPGGAVEPGETRAEAVIREVREEVGLAVEPVRELWTWQRGDGLLRIYWWSARVLDPGSAWRLAPAEVAEARWLKPTEVRRLPWLLESNLEFLQRFYS